MIWHSVLHPHIGRNCFNLFQITADADPGVSKDQKICEKLKKIHITRSTIQSKLSKIKNH